MLIEKMPVRSGEISGLGEVVVKLVNSKTGVILAYIGSQNGSPRVYFPATITHAELMAVAGHEAR